jgi:hypothetical protein
VRPIHYCWFALACFALAGAAQGQTASPSANSDTVPEGLGGARPRTEERFDAPTHTTFDGRALAIVRPNEAGTIEVTVSAEGCDARTVRIDARPATAASRVPGGTDDGRRSQHRAGTS